MEKLYKHLLVFLDDDYGIPYDGYFEAIGDILENSPEDSELYKKAMDLHGRVRCQDGRAYIPESE